MFPFMSSNHNLYDLVYKGPHQVESSVQIGRVFNARNIEWSDKKKSNLAENNPPKKEASTL